MLQEMTFSSAVNLTLMAKTFIQVVKGGVLKCYDDEDGRLRRDFGKFSIEHRPPSNYKLVAVSDEHGHADVGTALVICLPKAVELMGGFGVPDDGTMDESDEPLSKEEVEEMPDDLREIYEADDELEEQGRRRGKPLWDDRELF